MRTVTFLAIYHFSICVEDELIPAIEDALGFSVSDYSEINDIDSQHYILCWDNLPVPDNLSKRGKTPSLSKCFKRKTQNY